MSLYRSHNLTEEDHTTKDMDIIVEENKAYGGVNRHTESEHENDEMYEIVESSWKQEHLYVDKFFVKFHELLLSSVSVTIVHVFAYYYGKTLRLTSIYNVVG